MQLLILVYIFIAVLFVTYLILGIKAFRKYLGEDTEKSGKNGKISEE